MNALRRIFSPYPQTSFFVLALAFSWFAAAAAVGAAR
jgi:hypothetical protein